MGASQAKPEQMTATVLPSFTAGSLGMVCDSVGGRFCDTASFGWSLMTVLVAEKAEIETAYICSAKSPLPTTTICS